MWLDFSWPRDEPVLPQQLLLLLPRPEATLLLAAKGALYHHGTITFTPSPSPSAYASVGF